MAHVKMEFSVEVDGEVIIKHEIGENAGERSYFSQGRKLTKDIINKMNEFYSERFVDQKFSYEASINETQYVIKERCILGDPQDFSEDVHKYLK